VCIHYTSAACSLTAVAATVAAAVASCRCCKRPQPSVPITIAGARAGRKGGGGRQGYCMCGGYKKGT